MTQTVRVQLAEGGEGIVHEGDPAWDVCRALQRHGFTTLVLPRSTLFSGVPASLNVDSRLPAERLLTYAMAEDQMAEIRTESFVCIHHWRLEPPQPGKETVEATCKFCGTSRSYPAWADRNWSTATARKAA